MTHIFSVEYLISVFLMYFVFNCENNWIKSTANRSFVTLNHHKTEAIKKLRRKAAELKGSKP